MQGSMNKAQISQVLLVDDNPGDIQLTRIAFEETGLAVELTAAMTAAEARQLLGAGGYDLILLDLNLTDASGHDVLRWCKQQPALKSIPVVIVSTSDFPKDLQRSQELGAVDYIVKPNSFARFIELLKGLESWLCSGARREF